MRHTSVCSLFVCLASLMLVSTAQSQDVTTWHYDNYRTGWQQHETTLTPTMVQTNFGPVAQLQVDGEVYAQPLALTNAGINGCSGSCNVIFIATEQDMLYVFNADYPYNQVWPHPFNLATAAAPDGTYLQCSCDRIP